MPTLNPIPIGSNYSAKNMVFFSSVTTAGLGATTTVTGTAPGVDRFTSVELQCEVTATSGTNPTLDVYLQKQNPDGTTWTDLVHFGQYTTSNASDVCTLISQPIAPYAATDATLGAGAVALCHIGHTWRVKYVTSGTEPVFTFTLYASFYE